MLPFVSINISGVCIFISTLIILNFRRPMVKQMCIQFQLSLKSFPTTTFEANPVSDLLVDMPMFIQLTLELENFPTGVTLKHCFIMRVTMLQHTGQTRKGSVTEITFHRWMSVLEVSVDFLLAVKTFITVITRELAGTSTFPLKFVFYSDKLFMHQDCRG